MSGARELALAVVRDVFGPQARVAQAAFDAQVKRTALDARDRAFAAELAYGSIKRRRLLDWYLAPYVGERRKSLPPTILEILRLGVFQLRCMNGVDDHAAVFETVKLASRHGHRGTAGLVNAVLRRIAADAPPEPRPGDFERFDDYLGTRYSVPTWLAAAWRQTFDGASEAMLAGINAAPRCGVRVNQLRADIDSVRAELERTRHAVAASAFAGDALLVDGPPLGDDPQARFALQGEAATMPVDLLDPHPEEQVLDLCSGRGNKSVQLASRMCAQGALTCVELDPGKARRLQQTLLEAGATNAAVVEADAAALPEGPPVDAVLLDAPCSGLGILGRHPEARWRKTPDDPARWSTTQRRMLRAAVERLKTGGRLAYSVCSTDPREGVQLIDELLADHHDLTRAPLPERYRTLERNGDVVVPPGIEGRDGFYIALLARRR